MDKVQKHRFITELIDSVSKSLHDDIDKVPEEWNGVELREILADRFHALVEPDKMPLQSKRYNDYCRELRERNL